MEVLRRELSVPAPLGLLRRSVCTGRFRLQCPFPEAESKTTGWWHL